MACWIKKNIIGLTRADSCCIQLSLNDADGNPYEPSPDDIIKFGLKSSTDDDEKPIIEKIIPPETMELRLNPEETDIEPGDYYYDVEVTLAGADFVTTAIPPTRFKILPEVGNWRRWT